MSPLISVVDNDDSVCQATGRLVKSLGFTAEVFSCVEDFLKSDRLHDTSCLILDVHMPGITGIQLQTFLTAAGYRIPIIFVTASADEKIRARALQAGAVDFLRKPYGDRDLLSAIHSALNLGN